MCRGRNLKVDKCAPLSNPLKFTTFFAPRRLGLREMQPLSDAFFIHVRVIANNRNKQAGVRWLRAPQLPAHLRGVRFLLSKPHTFSNLELLIH